MRKYNCKRLIVMMIVVLAMVCLTATTAFAAGTGDVAGAVEAIANVASHSLAAAFVCWGQRSVIEYLLQSPNARLREQLLPMLLAKLQMMADDNFLGLARVAIAATIHSPERAQDMVARMGEREEGLTVWIRAALADGRLKTVNAEFAAQQVQGLLKSFGFWPQISMGLPPLDADTQKAVAESAMEMFLARYQL